MKTGLKEMIPSLLLEEKIVELPFKKADNELERTVKRFKKEEEKEVAKIADTLKKDIEGMLKGKEIKATGKGGLISGTVKKVSVRSPSQVSSGTKDLSFHVELTLDKDRVVYLNNFNASLIVY